MPITEEQRTTLRKYKKERVVKKEDCHVLKEFEDFLVVFLSDRDTDEITARLTDLGIDILFTEKENSEKTGNNLKILFYPIVFMWRIFTKGAKKIIHKIYPDS